MAASLQLKGGTTAKVAAYTPLEGELVLDLTTKKLYAGDGTTAGGNQIVASRKGVTDGSSAAAGDVGEVKSATSSSSVTLTSQTSANLVSLSLSAGDWEINGTILFSGSSPAWTSLLASINTTSATIAPFPNKFQLSMAFTSVDQAIPLIRRRLNVSSTTTVYLVGQAAFSSGTANAQGYIEARRLN